MQTTYDNLSNFSKENEKQFFLQLQTDKMLKLLYTINPTDAKIVFLKRSTAKQLEGFINFAEVQKLKRENIVMVNSLEEVNRGVDTIKFCFRMVSTSTQNLVLLAHRLLRNVKLCQRFIRKSLKNLKEGKQTLLFQWKSIQQNARKALLAETDRRSKMYCISQTSECMRDMSSLYLDCWQTESCMRATIDACLKERRNFYVTRYRKLRQQKRVELDNNSRGSSSWAIALALRKYLLDIPPMFFSSEQVTYTELCAHLQLSQIQYAISDISPVTEEGSTIISSMPSYVGPNHLLPSPVSYYHALTILDPRKHMITLMMLKELSQDVKLKFPSSAPTIMRSQCRQAYLIASKWHLVPFSRSDDHIKERCNTVHRTVESVNPTLFQSTLNVSSHHQENQFHCDAIMDNCFGKRDNQSHSGTLRQLNNSVPRMVPKLNNNEVVGKLKKQEERKHSLSATDYKINSSSCVEFTGMKTLNQSDTIYHPGRSTNEQTTTIGLSRQNSIKIPILSNPSLNVHHDIVRLSRINRHFSSIHTSVPIPRGNTSIPTTTYSSLTLNHTKSSPQLSTAQLIARTTPHPPQFALDALRDQERKNRRKKEEMLINTSTSKNNN